MKKFFFGIAVIAAMVMLIGCEQSVGTESGGALGLSSRSLSLNVGPGGYSDINDWELITAPFDSAGYPTVNSVAYGPNQKGVGQFVAVSGTAFDSAASVSIDGATWDDDNVTIGMPRYPSIIAYLYGTFLTGAGSGTTTGGYTDTPEISPWSVAKIGFGIKGITAIQIDDPDYDYRYIVGGASGRGAYTSDLSQTFTILTGSQTTFDQGSGSDNYINAAASNGLTEDDCIVVYGGGMGHTAYSSDGIHWATGTDSTTISEQFFGGNSGFINSIAYGNGFFVAVGGLDRGPGAAAYSENGSDWYTAGSIGIGLTGKVTTVAYGSIDSIDYFVAGDENGNAAYTTDPASGNPWTVVHYTGFGTEAINGITFGDGMFMAVGGTTEPIAAVFTNP
jgi:hypothetical protein